jgi:hypothetical protein
VPEQEFLPPRPPGRFRRPGPPRPPGPGPGPDGPYGHQDEDPPPWADLPPVRPARPARPAAGYPTGSRPAPGPAGSQPPPGSAWPPPGYAGSPGSGGSPGSRGSAGSPGSSGSSGSAGPRPEEEVPPWAGPDALSPESGAEGELPPGDQPYAPDERAGRLALPGRALRGRARRATARRRRWLIMIAGLVVVAGGVTAAVVIPGGPPPAPVTPGSLITTFQPGELQTVPDACGTVPAATVQQYLPGQVKRAAPLPIDGSAESACDWTIDHAPVYRLLELNLLAYAPSGLASGDGSATNAAIDAYSQTLQTLQDPSKHSAEPRATVIALSGFGNQAFSATQVFRRGGAVTDVATVVVRYHNVVVTATLNGLQHSNRGDYGPVSMSDLSSAALAFAQAAEATLHG